MEKEPIEIKVSCPDGCVPFRANPTDAGADLYYAGDEPVVIGTLSGATLGTGVKAEIPVGYMGEIRSRSGLFFKKGIFCTGTIDSDYRGEIKVCLRNLSVNDVVIQPRERIAQLCIVPVELCTFARVDEDKLSVTERGDGGFGSTGTR